jgi:LPS-assembly lipoprotein
MKMRILMIGLLLLTSACGFHLRGSQTAKFNIDNVYIHSSSATKLAAEVKSQLTSSGASVAKSAETAKYVLVLKQENFEKSVLSVNAGTGKVEEYQILYTAKMDVSQSDGKLIAEDDRISTSRDFTFDENAVLGKFSEEELLQEDIIRRAASQVLRRLQALTAK